MDRIKIKVNAKINLTLDVTGIRGDGYHSLDMCMASIGIGDILTCSLSDSIEVIMNGEVSGEWNIAYKALKACIERGLLGGMRVVIEKNIPISSGLGGSSADAAATLYAVKRLANCDDDTLIEIGNTLGSDVAFMYYGGIARAGGKGEELEQLPFKRLHLVIGMGEHGALTKDVFREYDKSNGEITDYTAKLMSIWTSGEYNCAGGRSLLNKANAEHDNTITVGNGLQNAAIAVNPEINNTLALIKQYTNTACMSGSGAGVFGIFGDEESAKLCVSGIQGKIPYAVVTATEPVGIVEIND